jgi:diguanylate cyclase (GGDEF)-like protein
LVILLAGLAVSICATYLLLASRSQTRRDSHKRIAQLQEIDPATGLVNDAVFAKRLVELIERAQRFGHQSAVAIVDFPNFAPLRSEFGRNKSIELLLRLSERLNAMMRTVDTVARLGEAKFGLLVDGPVAPSRARAMCAKVIAHCITPMAGLPMGMVAKPRIAMALVPGQGADAGDVVGLLEEMMRDAAGDATRVIMIAQASVRPAVSPTAHEPIGTLPGTTSRGDTEFQPTSASDEVD